MRHYSELTHRNHQFQLLCLSLGSSGRLTQSFDLLRPFETRFRHPKISPPSSRSAGHPHNYPGYLTGSDTQPDSAPLTHTQFPPDTCLILERFSPGAGSWRKFKGGSGFPLLLLFFLMLKNIYIYIYIYSIKTNFSLY